MIPVQRHSVTSVEAGEKIKPHAETLRDKVLDLLKSRGGFTDIEIQDILQMNPSTQRPRRIELVTAGLVQDSGSVRKTPSGRNATVWEVVTKFGLQKDFFL